MKFIYSKNIFAKKSISLFLLFVLLSIPIGGISQKRKKNKKNREVTEKWDSNAKIKAVFLYNFTKYIEWPSDYQTGEFKIGILGKNADLYKELDNMSKVKKIANRTFNIAQIDNLDKVKEFHIVYLTIRSQFSLKEIYSKIGSASVLVVSNVYPNDKTMINFVVEGTRQKFTLNPDEVRKRGLKVATALEKLAIIVGPNKSRDLNSKEKTPPPSKLSDKEFDALFIKMQKDLALEKTKSASKDKEIETLQKNIIQLESSILLKETELEIVQNKIKKQSQELKIILDSIELKEQEFLKNIKLAEQSKKDLEKAKESLQHLLNDQHEEFRLKELEIIASKKELEIQSNKLKEATIDLNKAQEEYKSINSQVKEVSRLLENQKFISYISIFILLIISILGIVAFKNYKKQKTQASIISKQKTTAESQRDEIHIQHEELEEKNKEITDSINYAKRIQEAILPPLKFVKSNLADSFIFYQPKDIVAGDFYWMETIEDLVIFAAADCTGHGVPGAMVSVVCSNALNRSVREFQLTEPAKILDKTLEIVLERFEKSEKEVKDGMDIALCAYNPKTLELQFAGAQNPVWIIRNGDEEVEEIKGDKQPIGRFAKHSLFNNHTIQLNKGDSAYLSSDGYVDQFGGIKGKKFMSSNFKRLLLSISENSMDEQNIIIQKSFNDWKGELEQLDDVCVIGFRA